jgi:hypothetical protein
MVDYNGVRFTPRRALSVLSHAVYSSLDKAVRFAQDCIDGGNYSMGAGRCEETRLKYMGRMSRARDEVPVQRYMAREFFESLLEESTASTASTEPKEPKDYI